MVRRKGAGYLIESIISIMVLLIFVAGSLNSLSTGGQDWLGFQEEIAASDATYVLKKTEHLDSLVSKGETGSIRAVSSALTDGKFDISGTISGPPTGRYLVGVFVEDDSDGDGAKQVRRWELTDSLGECGTADLTEIESEHKILRKKNDKGGETIYYADADPNDQDKGTKDYDTIWVDNKTQCEFDNSEGPHRLKDFVEIDGGIYQFEGVKNQKDESVMYYSPLTNRIQKRLKSFKSANVRMRRFNFTEELFNYDILIFKDKYNINEIDNNQEKLLSYAERGKIIFAMDKEDIKDKNTFLSKTGIERVDMDVAEESGVTREIIFGENKFSQDIKRYYGELGYDSTDVIKNSNNLSSGQVYFSRNELIAMDSKMRFQRDDWKVKVTPGETTQKSNAPEGVPTTDCDDAYIRATPEFKTDKGWEELTVYSTKLSGTTADCDDTRFSISIDKDKDGDFDEEFEEERLEGELTVVNERRYRPIVFSHDDFELRYAGEPRKEILSYTESFENQDTAGFAFAPGLSFPQSKRVSFLSATVFSMLEGQSFGPSETSPISTVAVGRTKSNVTYKLNMRWVN